MMHRSKRDGTSVNTRTGHILLSSWKRKPGSSSNWQGRLQGLLRQYDGRIVLLTSNAYEDPSSGPLVGLRVEPRRGSLRNDQFEIYTAVLKDKVGLRAEPASSHSIAPAGLRGTS